MSRFCVDGAAALFVLSAGCFLLSAAASTWAAYDRHVAGSKFALIVAGTIGALVLRAAGALDRDCTATGLRCSWAVLVAAVTALGAAWGRQTSESASAAVAVLLPLVLSDPGRLVAGLRRLQAPAVATCAAALAGCSLIAVSGEYSAWAAVAGAGSFVVVANLTQLSTPLGAVGWPSASGRLLAAAAVAATAYVSCIFAAPPTLPPWLPAGVATRLEVWREGAQAIGDYVFTGCGLGNAAMVLSSYVWLLHVPFTEHVHSLFLQVAVEQGAPGLGGLLGMLASAYWRLSRTLSDPNPVRRRRSIAAGASLAALVVYGMFESDLYTSRLLPLLFVPVGAAWLCDVQYTSPAPRGTGQRTAMFIVGTALVAVIAFALWRRAPSELMANLGAVAQTRAELAVFHWPQWEIQDRLRREQIVDLRPAMAWYEAALARDPNNVTALRRLGQIELSLGRYSTALRHLQRAYYLAPRSRATRQMLGEAYAVTGDIDKAVQLWTLTGNARGELDLRQWWYHHIGASREQEYVREAIRRLALNAKD